jgi:hypothetical protein
MFLHVGYICGMLDFGTLVGGFCNPHIYNGSNTCDFLLIIGIISMSWVPFDIQISKLIVQKNYIIPKLVKHITI